MAEPDRCETCGAVLSQTEGPFLCAQCQLRADEIRMATRFGLGAVSTEFGVAEWSDPPGGKAG